MQCQSDLKQVFVLLRGGESHCMWRRLSLAQLQSGFPFRRKISAYSMRQVFKSKPYLLCSICVNLAIFCLSIMNAQERITALNNICSLLNFPIENVCKHQQHNIAGTTHIFLTSCRFPAKDKCQYLDFQYLNILPPQLSK